MKEYSEDYKRIRAEVESWPDWKKETYNCNFATSKHAHKLNCADLVIEALRQKREVDALASEYGIDAKTMLALARSQIETAKANVLLQEHLSEYNDQLFDLAQDYITLRTKYIKLQKEVQKIAISLRF